MQRCGSRNWQELVIQKKNLAAAAEGENLSGQICMRALQKRLRKKVSMSLQQKFRAVGEIEKHHEERYRALLKNIETAQVFGKK